MDIKKSDENLIAAAQDHPDVVIVDRRQNKMTTKLVGHTENNFAVKFMNEHYLASGGEDVTTKIWDLRKPSE